MKLHAVGTLTCDSVDLISGFLLDDFQLNGGLFDHVELSVDDFLHLLAGQFTGGHFLRPSLLELVIDARNFEIHIQLKSQGGIGFSSLNPFLVFGLTKELKTFGNNGPHVGGVA